MFELDKKLAADTLEIADWPLCKVLLMNDCQYPWIILVPRVAGLREIYQLSDSQQVQFNAESVALGEWLMAAFDGYKLNVAALGNVVSQLHIHHVVRFESDAAWPAPVWGKFPAKPYSDVNLVEVRERLSPLTKLVS